MLQLMRPVQRLGSAFDDLCSLGSCAAHFETQCTATKRSFAKPFALLPVGRKLREKNSFAKNSARRLGILAGARRPESHRTHFHVIMVVVQDSHETVKGKTLETLHPKFAKNLAH